MLILLTRVYDHYVDATDVVQELRKAGPPEHDISLITPDDRVTVAARGAEIGAVQGGLAGLLTGLGLVMIPGIGPVVTTGWLAATAAGAAAGGLAGGALGVLSQAGLSGEEAHAIAECLRRHVGDGPGAGGRQKPLRGHHERRGDQPAGPRRRLPRNGMDVV
jgi:hypothetical protein